MTDELLRSALLDAIRVEYSDILSTAPENLPAPAFSAKYCRRMGRLLRNPFRFARPRWQKALQAAAMLLLALGLTFALLWTNPTARAWIQRYLRIHHDEVGMDEYVFQNSEEQEISQGKIRPSYIPEGYVETDAFELSGQWYITYTDGRGGQIELAILPIKTGSFLVFDTDHSTSSAISIHGMDGQLYTALSAEWPNVLILFDETNGLCYYLESNEPAQVLIQIANSLSK